MTDPCDKGPLIEMIISEVKEARLETNHKLDAIHDVLSVVAVQQERVDTQGKKLLEVSAEVKELSKKVSTLELRPLRRIQSGLKWLGGIGSALVIAAGIYLLGF